MDKDKLLLKEISNFADYVRSGKTLLGLLNLVLSLKTGVSDGEISKKSLPPLSEVSYALNVSDFAAHCTSMTGRYVTL